MGTIMTHPDELMTLLMYTIPLTLVMMGGIVYAGRYPQRLSISLWYITSYALAILFVFQMALCGAYYLRSIMVDGIIPLDVFCQNIIYTLPITILVFVIYVYFADEVKKVVGYGDFFLMLPNGFTFSALLIQAILGIMYPIKWVLTGG